MKVVALAAITADGMIARGSTHLADWTSREDKRMFASKTRQAGAVIMGRATYETLPASLSNRLVIVLTAHPEQYLSMPGEVEYVPGPAAAVLARLESAGFNEAIVAGGASVYRYFLVERLLDELWVTIEPRLFGQGLSLLGDMPVDVSLRLLQVVELSENTVQLRYAIRHGE